MKRTALKRKSATKKGRAAFKRAKKESVSAWKKKADAVFSVYIRNKYADAQGIVECYTCGKRAHWKTMQCGHFVARNNSATRFDEDNCRVQDVGCNVWGRGRYDVYADKLMDELGVKRFRALLKRGRSNHQLTVPELKAIVEKYQLIHKPGEPGLV
jgi:hypothetical protein